ncbi:hypothetical protein D3C76_630280 [compost metagenome]
MTDGGEFLALQALHPGGVDAGALQHGLVGPAGVEVPAGEEDRRGGPLAGVEAPFQFVEPVPVAGRQAAHHEEFPATRLAVVAPLAQALLQFVERQQLAVEIGLVHLQPALGDVGVGVDEARHQHLAVEVEDPGRRLFQAQHLVVGTHRQQLAVLHRHRLLQGLARFGGVDPGVVQDQVDSGHSFQRGTGERAGEQQGEDRLHRVGLRFLLVCSEG